MPGLPGVQRKTLILDAAQQLFSAKGYQATTIEDILADTGIAKGTLYYHFRNKEAIMDAIIARTADAIVARAEVVVASEVSPEEKVVGVIRSARVTDATPEVIADLHSPENSAFHIRSVLYTVQRLAPVLAAAIAEGVRTGAFQSEQPLEDAEVVLVAGFMLTDDGFFPGESDELRRRAMGVIRAAERLLGCSPGALLTVLGG